MIPIAETTRRSRRPYVLGSLLAANVAVLLAALGSAWNLDLLVRHWGAVPAEVTAALTTGRWLDGLMPLLASTFVHGSPFHLGGNLLFAWVFGRAVEDRLGHTGFMAFYLLAAVASGLSQVFVHPANGLPMIGASGAVAGILGAYLVLFPLARVSLFIPLGFAFRTASVPAVLVLGTWLAFQVSQAMLVWSSGLVASSQVAWFAHLGGFLAGVILAPPLAVAARVGVAARMRQLRPAEAPVFRAGANGAHARSAAISSSQSLAAGRASPAARLTVTPGGRTSF